MSEHVWTQENIGAYLAGGLDPAEGERLEKHAVECTGCASDIDKGRALSQRLSALFVEAKPGPALEDEIIRALPAGPPPRHGWRPRAPLTRNAKIILAAAASVLLAFVGAGAIAMMEEDHLRLPATPPRAIVAQNESRGESVEYSKKQSGQVEATPGDQAKNGEKGQSGEKDKKKDNVVDGTIGTYKSGTASAALKSAEDLAKELREENLKLLSKEDLLSLNKQKSSVSLNYGLNLPQLPPATPSAPVATITPPASSPKVEPGYYYDRPNASEGASKKPGEGLPDNRDKKDLGKLDDKGGEGKGERGRDTSKDPDGRWYDMLETGKKAQEKAVQNALVWKYTNKGTLPPLDAKYFQPGGDALSGGDKDKEGKEGRDGKDGVKLGSSSEQGAGKSKGDPEDSKRTTSPGQEGPGREGDAGQKGNAGQKEKLPPKQLAGQPELPMPRKIIIRSGELEFEIDSFDTSVTTIMRLVTASKGGFIATINSDKLANGKVRGSVVVRMPPEQLDKFILDLRKELAKVGELKNQHLGSTDVTKQYTDLESRLRAARTMEERLISIIKSGKGEIKDLLQAEKELGVWRTKIEEMEGEIRYYNNLASLSTLTIKLFEKEIRTAAMVTENERVQAGIEVEDVEKAYQDALKAINDAKGRVSKSELKQHTAGQFNAILHFEVSPEATGPTRDRLRQLGNMVRLQIDRIQQSENGNVVPRDAKVKRGDTQFLVSIYNLANVAPRETVILRLALTDVPATYQKLRGLIAKVKGGVINAQLNEQDRQNINAQLDFHVSRAGESDIQAALVGAGETLARQVNRVPESENVTDSKVLYRVALVDADSIQPRETVTARIAAQDVPTAYQKLRATLEKLKARIINAQLNEQDRRNITAQLDFAFKRSDEGAVQMALAAAGESLNRQVARLPEAPTVTDAKVLVRLVLIHSDSLPPRDTVTLKIAAADVPTAYQKLRDAIGKAKGRVTTAQLNEQDRRNITGQLRFEVPRGEVAAMQAALTEAGETLTRQAAREQDTTTVTDTRVGFQVDLLPADAIPPRETTTLKIAAVDVPAAYQKLRDAIGRAKGRVLNAELNELDRRNITANITFDVPRSEGPAGVQSVLSEAGEVLMRQVARKQETASVTDSRIGFHVDFSSAATIPPRETTVIGLEVADVKTVLTLITAEAKEVDGRLINPPQETQTRDGKVTGQVIIDVPLAASASLIQKIKAIGRVLAHDPTQDPKAPEGKLALARIVVVVSSGEALIPRDKGLWSQIRHGLAFSLRGLSISASWLIVGLLFVLPWVLLVYAVVWLARRMWRGPAVAANPPPT